MMEHQQHMAAEIHRREEEEKRMKEEEERHRREIHVTSFLILNFEVVLINLIFINRKERKSGREWKNSGDKQGSVNSKRKI